MIDLETFTNDPLRNIGDKFESDRGFPVPEFQRAVNPVYADHLGRLWATHYNAKGGTTIQLIYDPDPERQRRAFERRQSREIIKNIHEDNSPISDEMRGVSEGERMRMVHRDPPRAVESSKPIDFCIFDSIIRMVSAFKAAGATEQIYIYLDLDSWWDIRTTIEKELPGLYLVPQTNRDGETLRSNSRGLPSFQYNGVIFLADPYIETRKHRRAREGIAKESRDSFTRWMP